MTSPAFQISVVVPTHGRTDLFRQTLASLEAQTLDTFEVIVTDDSRLPDDRATIQTEVMKYAAKTKRTARYVFSVPLLGQAKNTNQGLRLARGQFVRILHSDDLLAPRALEAELALLTDPRLNLDVLFHHVEAFSDAPRFEQQPVMTLIQPSLLFRSCLHSSTPLPSATIFRRDILDEVGGMREDFDFLCDWDLFVRVLSTQHRRHRFVAQLTPGFVGWRVHPNSTTGRLWHRHFLEHEQFMQEMRGNEAYCEALIGDRGTRDGFFATAVRYRYRRLAEDISKMAPRQLWQALPTIVRCALSPVSLRERLTPAPWTPRGAKRYPRLVVECDVPNAPAPPPKKVVAPAARFHEPRTGLRFVLSAYASGAIIRAGKAWAARHVDREPSPADQPAPLAPLAEGPEPLFFGDIVEVHHKLAVASPSAEVVRVATEYNNTTNFWPLRRLMAGAQTVRLLEVNANTFVESVVHQALKHVAPGAAFETQIYDNQHLTSFGFKSMLDRLFSGQFQWSAQRTDGPFAHMLRYVRRAPAPRTYTASHTGWTFGILTTGQRLANVEAFVDAVERYCDEAYEVLIVSPVDVGALAERPGVRVLAFNENDDLGWITRKKNLICAEAAYSDILVCHDRFAITPDFTEQFRQWGFSYGLAAPRVRLPDGRRGVDWAVVSSQNQVWSNGGLLDYRAYSQYAYNPGGATIIRKAFWRQFPWNENLFWNEHEDVELCRRVQRSGGVIALAASTIVAAEDRWVDHNPRIPYCDQNEVLFGRPVGEQRIHFIRKEQAA